MSDADDQMGGRGGETGKAPAAGPPEKQAREDEVEDEGQRAEPRQ